MANHREIYDYHARMENGRWVSPPNWREGRQDGFQATHDDRPNGSVDKGTPYEEVPVSVGPSSSGRSTMFSWIEWGGRSNTNAQAEGGYSAGGTRVAGNQRSYNYGEERSGYHEHPSRVIESKGVNGDYSQNLGDLQRFPVQKETSTNELEVSYQKIASLENHNKRLEEDLRTTMKSFHSQRLRADATENENQEIQRKLEGLSREKVRADAFEKENREIQRKLEGLYREKVHADAFEKENREIQRKLEGLYREKERADALEIENSEIQRKLEGLYREKVHADVFEKENREIQRKLEGLYREKVRADSLESENREYQVKLKKEEQEVGELQSKLQDALAAKELEVAGSKTLQNSLKGIRLENQELNSWKLERERKGVQDTSTAGQFRTRIADLTHAKGQLEKKELQLTNQVLEQTRRIEDLKQQNAVLVVKMGALVSQVQSLLERLHDEREKLQQRNTEVEELKQQQPTNQVQEQTRRIEDLKQQNAVLVVKMRASESQVQSLLERLHDEREKLQRRNTEIEELKQQLKPQVITADKEAQVDDQEARERVLKEQCSDLEQQVRSKELETQSLSLTLSKLNERLRLCDLEIDDLKHQILDRENRDSQEYAVTPPKQYIGGESFLESEATPYLLDGAVQRVHEGAGIFARLLMKAMEQGKIDGMAVARNNFVRAISVGKAAPLKYVLEAITCKLLFQSFEHECFDLQESTSGFLDMELQRMDNFRQYKYLNSIEFPEQLVLTEDTLFTQFCRIKLESLSAAIPEIESMMQEVISRTFDRSFSSDDTSTDVATYLASKLGSTFVKLAVCVWQVHKLAFAFNPVARIFRVAQSEKFVEKYMESVIFQESESEDEDMSKVDISRVDFMVVPGFLINRIVIRSRVFVVTKPMLSAFQYRSGETQPVSM